MKTRTVTKDEESRLRKMTSFASAVFLEEYSIFELTKTDGKKICVSKDYHRSMIHWAEEFEIHYLSHGIIKAVIGSLEEVFYFTANLSNGTDLKSKETPTEQFFGGKVLQVNYNGTSDYYQLNNLAVLLRDLPLTRSVEVTRSELIVTTEHHAKIS